MRLTIIAVGKIRERYLQDGIAEYQKRLQRFATVEIREIAEEQAPETLSPAQQEQLKTREADRILAALRPDQYVIALAIEGASRSSEALANHFSRLTVESRADIALIIGGSLGLAPTVLTRADMLLSFGALTYPHQLMRLILLEQLYRVCKIMRGEPYHK